MRAAGWIAGLLMAANMSAVAQEPVRLYAAVGGADSPPPPKDRSVYGMLMEQQKADVFLTYCTNALLAQREVPALKIVQLPEALAVGAEYGMTVLNGSCDPAQRFAKFILSAPGQQILARHGFASIK